MIVVYYYCTMENKMKEKFIRFMYGRYGIDLFSKCLIYIGVGITLITMLFNSSLLYFIGLGLIGYSYFRIFSKNISKRYAENQFFLNKTSGIRKKLSSWKQQGIQKKTHHIYSCPSCQQKIRVPRGKGKIEIRCPKCSTTFVKRS